MKIWKELELGLRKVIYEMGMKRFLIMETLIFTLVLAIVNIFTIKDLALTIGVAFTASLLNLWWVFAFFNLFVIKGRVKGRKVLKWD